MFTGPEMTIMSHLYRGELYRSKIWRTRLDMTTNWAVGTTGIALSITFSQADNSPLILILVSLLVIIFLFIEARRYRYFDIWRTRVRLLETSFFPPVLRLEGTRSTNNWNELLAHDYENLRFHISFFEALGRRLRRNYCWIFLILMVSYLAKILLHPTPLTNTAEFWQRAAIGPISGEMVVLFGLLFNGALALFAVGTITSQRASGRVSDYHYRDDLIIDAQSPRRQKPKSEQS